MLDEMSRNKPFRYSICLHADAAKERGIKDGDIIRVEKLKGRSMTGRAKLMKGIHPWVVASVTGGGGWVKGRPIVKGKGAMFNDLLINDMEHKCPVT